MFLYGYLTGVLLAIVVFMFIYAVLLVIEFREERKLRRRKTGKYVISASYDSQMVTLNMNFNGDRDSERVEQEVIRLAQDLWGYSPKRGAFVIHSIKKIW